MNDHEILFGQPFGYGNEFTNELHTDARYGIWGGAMPSREVPLTTAPEAHIIYVAFGGQPAASRSTSWPFLE